MKNNSFSNQDQEKFQKHIFYLLYEYAVKFTFRYTSHQSDTEHYVHEGFARLFQQWKYVNSSDLNFIKQLLKEILIKVCIELELKNTDLNIALMNFRFLYFNSSKTLTLNNFSPKQIIDVVKSLPFALRLLYNLSIIDGYKMKKFQ